MANEEHLKILRQGVEAWNAWRNQNPGSCANLEDADLHGADLRGISFSLVYLDRANLEGANLEDGSFVLSTLMGANLKRARLSRVSMLSAGLQGANISDATLFDANLFDSDLSGADLRSAKLVRANLTRAELKGAKLHQSVLAETTFGNTDLSAALGLKECDHKAPCTVDWRTVERSGGLPEEFLRGCGWLDWQIEATKLAQPGLSRGQITRITGAIADRRATNPFSYYSCFISYSHADKPFARWLEAQLQARGITCYLDEKQLLPGDDIYRAVDRGIHQYDKFLLCASRDSLTSWWVDNEIATVFAKEQRLMKERGEKLNLLLPLDLDAHLFSDDFRNGKQQQLRERLAANFQGWQPDSTGFSTELDRVVKALRADDGARPSPPPSLLK